MITSETLRLDFKADKRSPLYLAPFGEREFEAVLPLDLEGLHFPKDQLKNLAETTPQKLMFIEDRPGLVEWGIYQEAVDPDNFLGTIWHRGSMIHGKRRTYTYTQLWHF